MIDPFAQSHTDLLNISTAIQNLSTDLIHAQMKGISAMRAEDHLCKITCPQIKRFTEKTSAQSMKAQVVMKVYQDESAVTNTMFSSKGR